MRISSRGPHYRAKLAASWHSLLKKREHAGWSRAVWSVAIYCSLLAAMVFVPSVAQAQVPEADSLALVALYDATGGDTWDDNTNWKIQAVEEWEGVTVHSETGQVTSITLAGNELNGSIPVEIGDLTALEMLSLYNNDLTGGIPSSIENLTELKELRLSYNYLTGGIPSSVGDLTALETLSLFNNDLTGGIPSSIENLTELKELLLSNNDLTGGIPSSIGDLTALEMLSLYNNDLTGEIPSSIEDLTELEVLSLSGNDLTGGIPSGIEDLTDLEVIALGGNNLTGGIPSDIGNLTALEILSLYDNALTGGIPSSIKDLAALEEFSLSGNDLTGEIPSGIGNLTALEYLRLDNNDLTGGIPSGIGDLMALEYLRLNNNDLTGEIPESFSNLMSLSTFYAGGTNNVCIPSGLLSWHNGISQKDSLPECASPPTVSVTPETLSVNEGAGSAQLTLELSEVHSDTVTVDWATSDGTATAGNDYTAGNETVNFAPNETRKTIDIAITDDALVESDETFTVTLSSPLNAELGTAKTTTVTITDNDTDAERAALVALYDATDGDNWTEKENWKTQKPIGEWYGVRVENGAVTELNLQVNNLTGTLPPEIGNLTGLGVLWLEGNDLTGSIPAEIGNLTSLTRLALSSNQLSGSIPSEIGNLTRLEMLWLNYNRLSGSIPSETWNLTSLQTLSLEHNNLSGSIPSEIENLTRLEILKISINSLSGEIPAEIKNLTSLRSILLDENDLTGVIPAEIGKLTNLETLSLSDNSLSGAIPDEIENLTSLQDLWLSNNALSGSIPAEIGKLTSLEVLDLGHNTELTGELPMDLRLLPINYLDISETCISTPADSDFQTWLAGITFLDTDRACGVGVTVTPTTLTVPEGAGAKYTVVLDTQPSADVTISVSRASGSDEDITVDKTSLTFTPDNWDAAQDVTVSAAEDDDATDGTATIEHTASNGGYDNVSVSSVTATEEDNDNDADAERAALVALYDATDGDNWNNNTNWKSEKPVVEWYGVTVENGAVTELDLEVNNLTGTLPTEIGNLTRLRWLSLGDNLTGAIPTEIGNLTRLRWLSLGGNLTGAIPTEIGNLTNLRQLFLSSSSLSGAIPTEIGNLTNLEELWLPDNSLTGAIPTEIGNLTSLTNLQLHSNSFTGAIPATIGNLINLEALDLSQNSLTGEIPADIGKLTKLGSLGLWNNSLTGAMPATIENLTSLETLYVNDNTELTGELPTGLRFLPITILNIRNTCITTPADSDFQAWLLGINFSDTDRVCAQGVTVTPTTLTVPEGSNAKYTVVLDAQPSADVTISASFASGSDEDITVDKTSLVFTPDNWDVAQEVTVSAAEDTDTVNGSATIEHTASGGGYGDVPVSSVTATEADNDNDADAERAALVALYDATDGDNWTDNTNWKSAEPVGEWYGVTVENDAVTKLELEDNNLTGTLPPEIGNLTRLQELDLAGNSLSGAIPTEIGNLTNLETLSLSSNSLSGAIPSEIGNLTSLKWLQIVNNGLSGSIPDEIGNLTSLKWLRLDVNQLGGEIPTEIWNLTSLEELGLSNNSLSGAIPAGIEKLTSLEWLALQSNRLSGAIPSEIWNLISLTQLYLDTNQLSGAISSEIENLISLRVLSLAGNALSGSIPSEIGNLASLGQLELHNNDLSGEIPSEIGDLTSLEWLRLNGNNLTGAIPTEIENLTSLEHIELAYNTGLTGELPMDLRLLPINYLDISETCISTPADSDFQTWLASITFLDTDRACGVGVTVTPTALTVPEGSNAKYTVVLDAQPFDDVRIMLSLASGSDPDITVDKTLLTFTPDTWNAAQEVTVSAAEDDDALNGAATIEHSAESGGYGDVSVSSVTATEEDNDKDAVGVTVTPTALTVAEGGSATYTVVLDTQPSADVTISASYASGSDEDITVDKTSLTFTPDTWDAAQEVTVSAAEDDDALNGEATIEHSASGGGYGDVTISSVTATEEDNDTAGVTVTPTALTIPEGGSATYTVALDTQPSADVTISLSFAAGSDKDITVDNTSLVFTPENWDAAQEVTVSAAEDDDAINGVATIEHAASGEGYDGVTVSSVTATEADNDTRGVTVTPTALPVPEGGSATYAVVLDTQPSDNVTIAASFAAGSDEDITADKTSLTFTTENWSMAQEITVSAAVDDDTVDDTATLNHRASGGDYGGVTVADVIVTVTDVIGGVDVSAWLARSSRVSADHLLSSVENRMESSGRGASGMQASVAGQRVAFGDSPARPGMGLSGASALWSASQDYTTSSLGSGLRSGNSFGISPGLHAAASRYRNMTLRDALSRSAFRYARETSWGNAFGIWGQGAFSRFGGSEAGADLTGDVMSGTVGIDHRISGWLHGLAVSRSESEGAYRIAGEDSLSLSAALTGVYPYARYNLTDRLRVWGTGGYGNG